MTIIAPDQGTMINALMTHKVDVADLPSGGVAIIEGVLPPGEFIGPHTHEREDEISYILQGTVTFLVGGVEQMACAGSYVLKPRGVPHAFWNAGDTPARVMEIHTPGGFEHFYDDMEVIMRAPDRSDAERMTAFAETAARYGVRHHVAEGAQLHARLTLPSPPHGPAHP